MEARVSEFSLLSVQKSKINLFMGGGEGVGGGARVSDFFTKDPNFKNKIFLYLFFFCGGGGGRGWRWRGRGDWCK